MSTALQDMMEKFKPKETQFVDTGIDNLNLIWGGGLPLGKMIEIHSEAGIGKTTIALDIAKALLKQGSSVAFLDVENSLTEELKQQMDISYFETNLMKNGLSQFLHLTPSTYDQLEETVNHLLTDEADIDLIIWDSITMTVVDKQKGSKAKSISSEEGGLTARVQARFLKHFKNELYSSGTAMIILNQMRTNLKGWNAKSKPAGGKALEFIPDIRTGISFKKPMTEKVGEEVRRTGAELVASTTKNKITLPNIEVPIILRFGYGVDNSLSTAMFLIHKKEIPITSAGWYLVPGHEKPLHGIHKVREWVFANEDYCSKWVAQFKI